MAICDWPVERRPRERLLAEGPEALLDAELLAVLLRTGVEGKDAIELGRELLVRFGGINGLLSAGRELLGVKGLGEAKAAARLMKAVEAVCADRIFTPDLGGNARTRDVTAAVIGALG